MTASGQARSSTAHLASRWILPAMSSFPITATSRPPALVQRHDHYARRIRGRLRWRWRSGDQRHAIFPTGTVSDPSRQRIHRRFGQQRRPADGAQRALCASGGVVSARQFGAFPAVGARIVDRNLRREPGDQCALLGRQRFQRRTTAPTSLDGNAVTIGGQPAYHRLHQRRPDQCASPLQRGNRPAASGGHQCRWRQSHFHGDGERNRAGHLRRLRLS